MRNALHLFVAIVLSVLLGPAAPAQPIVTYELLNETTPVGVAYRPVYNNWSEYNVGGIVVGVTAGDTAAACDYDPYYFAPSLPPYPIGPSHFDLTLQYIVGVEYLQHYWDPSPNDVEWGYNSSIAGTAQMGESYVTGDGLVHTSDFVTKLTGPRLEQYAIVFDEPYFNNFGHGAPASQVQVVDDEFVPVEYVDGKLRWEGTITFKSRLRIDANSVSSRDEGTDELSFSNVSASSTHVFVPTYYGPNHEWNTIKVNNTVGAFTDVKVKQGTTTVLERSISWDDSGVSSVRLKLESGTYTVSFKAPNQTLRRTWTGYLDGETITLADLIRGDIDDDNEIGPGDFALLSDANLEDITSPRWNDKIGVDVNGQVVLVSDCDLDFDGEVGPGDFAILASNFLETGD